MVNKVAINKMRMITAVTMVLIRERHHSNRIKLHHHKIIRSKLRITMNHLQLHNNAALRHLLHQLYLLVMVFRFNP